MRPRIWLPWWLWLMAAFGWLVILAVLACVWLTQALFVLPMAGLFFVFGDRESARHFAATLNWRARTHAR